MINKYYLPMLLIFFSTILSAQEDYMQVIADKSCECLAERKEVKSKLSSEEIGTCLLIATKDYKDQILKDYNLDLNDLGGGNGERLGELIGSKMAFACPELIMGTANAEQENTAFTATGKILTITKETFVVFELKNDNGKVEKFYWLSYVESDLNLQSKYDDLSGKQVQIDYIEQELFDSRINEYRKFNLITALRKE